MKLFMYLLLTPLLASTLSQSLKLIFNMIFDKRKFKITSITADGSYPSSHTAFMTSITAIAWFNTIFKWLEYGEAEIWIWCSISITMLYIIVIRDAMGVRYTVQKLCECVTELSKETKQADAIKEKLDIKSGHQPHEVIAGACFGLIVASFTSCLYYGWYKYLVYVVISFVTFIIVSFLILKNKRKNY